MSQSSISNGVFFLTEGAISNSGFQLFDDIMFFALPSALSDMTQSTVDKAKLMTAPYPGEKYPIVLAIRIQLSIHVRSGVLGLF